MYSHLKAGSLENKKLLNKRAEEEEEEEEEPVSPYFEQNQSFVQNMGIYILPKQFPISMLLLFFFPDNLWLMDFMNISQTSCKM